MVIIRNDDVLIKSEKHDCLVRVKQLHSHIVTNSKFLHIPALLCRDLKTFDGALEFIKSETEQGRMFPEVHGWEHIDYGNLSYDEIVKHLTWCIDWFKDNLPNIPTKFFTPWAGESLTIDKACKSVGLEMVGGKRNFIEPHKYLNKDYPLIDGCTIAMHWWKTGDFNRTIRIIGGEISLS